MKKLLLTLTIVAATAMTMYGQGRVNFNNYASGNNVTIDPLNDGVSGATGAFVGANYSVELLYAAGTFADLGSFLAANPTVSASTTFFGATGGNPNTDGAGQFDGGSIGGLTAGTTYTMQMRAWYNTGFATYALAAAGGRNVGTSALFTIVPTAAPTPAPDTTVAPFTVGIVPEPSTFALAGLGAAALLLFRRRK